MVRLPFGTAHLPRERVGAATTLASARVAAEAYVEEALRWLPKEGVSGIEQEPEQRETAAAVSESVVPPLPPVSASPPPSACRLRILLADDNADMRD
jgi:hypothetical protein